MELLVTRVTHEQIDDGYELVYGFDSDRVTEYVKYTLLDDLDGVSYDDLELEHATISEEKLESFIELQM
jgi:hypothetical protein